MTRRNVVLPQPDGPMNDTNSPLLIVRSTSDSACTGPSLVWKVSPSLLAETTAGDASLIGYRQKYRRLPAEIHLLLLFC